MGRTILGESLPNIPWEERPAGNEKIIWRYSGNPIIRRNPTKNTARIFNSAVVPYKGEFVGVFRADHNNSLPNLHWGRSKDAITWEIQDEVIQWKDENGKSAIPSYGYDPRLVKIEDTYTAVAFTQVDELIDFIKTNSKRDRPD